METRGKRSSAASATVPTSTSPTMTVAGATGTTTTTALSSGPTTCVSTVVFTPSRPTPSLSLQGQQGPVTERRRTGMHFPTCPVFIPGQISAEDWLLKYNTCCNAHGVSDVDRLSDIVMFLSEAPLQWFNTLSPADRVSWQAFCDAFHSRFTEQDHFHRFNLINATKQLPNEPVVDFVTKMQHLSRPLNFTENQLLPSLINNVLPHLKPEILRSRPTTLKGFIEAARLAESIHQVTANTSDMAICQIQQLQEQFQNLSATVSNQFASLNQSVSSLHAPDSQPINQRFIRQTPQRRSFPNPSTTRSQPRQFSPRPMVPSQQYHQEQRDRNWEKPMPLKTNFKPCLSCNGYGHLRRDCPNRDDTCELCGRKYHTTAACQNPRFQHLKNPQ